MPVIYNREPFAPSSRTLNRADHIPHRHPEELDELDDDESSRALKVPNGA